MRNQKPYCAEKQRVDKLATELAESKEGLKQVVDTLNELKGQLVVMSGKKSHEEKLTLPQTHWSHRKLEKNGAAVLVRSWIHG